MKKLTLIPLLLLPLFGNNISYLNSIRQSVGLNKLQLNQDLDIVAQKHANYLVAHSINSHYEKSGAKFYAQTPSKRAIKSGYLSKYIKENIVTDVSSTKKAIDVLFSAIYHRFVFLDFAVDEIGVGIAKNSHNKVVKNAYVYDLGLSLVAKMCQQEYLTLEGVYYMQDLCKDSTKYIPKSDYEKAIKDIQSSNPKVVLYPNKDASGVIPAFFDEKPNPMPGYKVSGYPISVELNPSYFKDIKIKRFRLYDAKGMMIRAKLLRASNDPNKKLKDYQFAIIPLQRLDYDATYKTYFEANTNRGRVKLKWKFHTLKFDKPTYKITKQYTQIKTKQDSIILYIKPRNRKDIITKIKIKGKAKIDFIDANTLQLSKIATKKTTLYVGDEEIHITKE